MFLVVKKIKISDVNLIQTFVFNKKQEFLKLVIFFKKFATFLNRLEILNILWKGQYQILEVRCIISMTGK